MLLRFVIPLLLLAAPQAALGLQILPAADDRRIELSLVPDPAAVVTASPAFSVFSETLFFVGAGEATQNTSLGATTLSGSGGDFTDGAGATEGRTRFDVTFRVDEPAAYDLTGELFGDLIYFTLALTGPSGTLFTPALAGTTLPFADSGLLLPGLDYRLVIESRHPSAMGTVGPNEWNFVFAIDVPEPDAFALWLGVAAALATHTRRARRS